MKQKKPKIMNRHVVFLSVIDYPKNHERINVRKINASDLLYLDIEKKSYKDRRRSIDNNGFPYLYAANYPSCHQHQQTDMLAADEYV